MDQWTREIPIIASRGKIVDSNGVVLADNKDTYSIFVRKKAVKNIDDLATKMSEILSFDKDWVYSRLTKTSSSEVTLATHIEKDKIDKIISQNFSGVYFSRDNTREYPYGDFFSQTLGFTSNDNNGQSGLEQKYNKYLAGKNGEILYETDIVGVEIDGSTPSYVPATDGLNLKLTIDYEIQQLAETAMTEAYELQQAKATSVIVMNPNNGEILALASKPSFDLNDVPRNDSETLNKVNRNLLITDSFEPGSTFKIITATANMEEYYNGNPDAFSDTHIFSSSRYRFIDGQRIKCWSDHKNGKHSNLNLCGALINSCNPIFVDIAMSLGKDTMYKYIENFGFGSVTGVDFAGEAQGMLLPKSVAQNVDLARIGFGQTIACTGIQLAAAVSAVVNGGKYYTPHLVKEIYSNEGLVAEYINPKLINTVISKKTSSAISGMLESVVSVGSGKNAYIEGYKVGGKTGTAQKYENGVIAQGKYVASFVGFFPSDKPQYLALVVIDEPVGEYYGSLIAAPYTKNIFEGIIKLKNIKPFI